MSTIRHDPLTQTRVVVAPHRIPAPPAFGRGRLPEVPRCPFCPGNEHLCAPDLSRLPRQGSWSVRAFPNRRPGLSLESASGPLRTDGLRGWGGRGAHEVLVLGREHGRLSQDERHRGLLLAAERMADLAQDPAFQAIGWYRNRGVEAGASQPHDHAQIVAMPVPPSRLSTIWRTQRDDPKLLPTLVQHARDDGRIVLETGALIAWSPWAPITPFQVRICPKAAVGHWHEQPEILSDLAASLHDLTAALDGMSGFTSHNLIASCAPPRGPAEGSRWVVELLPRIVTLGGFEAWSGGAMQPIDPEVAAAMLRTAVA